MSYGQYGTGMVELGTGNDGMSAQGNKLVINAEYNALFVRGQENKR